VHEFREEIRTTGAKKALKASPKKDEIFEEPTSSQDIADQIPREGVLQTLRHEIEKTEDLRKYDQCLVNQAQCDAVESKLEHLISLFSK
jgi:hypothetical protein